MSFECSYSYIRHFLEPRKTAFVPQKIGISAPNNSNFYYKARSFITAGSAYFVFNVYLIMDIIDAHTLLRHPRLVPPTVRICFPRPLCMIIKLTQSSSSHTLTHTLTHIQCQHNCAGCRWAPTWATRMCVLVRASDIHPFWRAWITSGSWWEWCVRYMRNRGWFFCLFLFFFLECAPV